MKVISIDASTKSTGVAVFDNESEQDIKELIEEWTI